VIQPQLAPPAQAVQLVHLPLQLQQLVLAEARPAIGIVMQAQIEHLQAVLSAPADGALVATETAGRITAAAEPDGEIEGIQFLDPDHAQAASAFQFANR